VETHPARRIIGRILSLGFPLPGVRVDNYSFVSAPSLSDYDALVIDPSALSRLIEGIVAGEIEARTFGDRPVRNIPDSPEDAALLDVLMRRRDETKRLLDNGGVVVCFAHPRDVHRIHGADALDDYFFLDGVPPLTAADGTQAHVVDAQHPMAAFAIGQSANIGYRARVAADAAPGGSVFVRSYGGEPIGFDVPCESGRVVFVPALKTTPAGDARYTMSEDLQAGIRRMLGVIAEGREPYWVSPHSLPGLDERAARLAGAQSDLASAQSALTGAEGSYEELARFRRLLWQEGQVGLEDVVLEALRTLGFDVYAQDPVALELRAEGASVLLEIDASTAAVGMAPHHRLRQRIERAIERRGEAPRGLLIVNGYRLQAPDERPPQASDALRIAAETMRYCVTTTASLYDAVAAKLAGDEGAVAAFRRRIISSDGLV
jgi:hypothetical protein